MTLGDTLRWRFLPGADRPAVEPPEVLLARLLQSGFPVWSFTLPSGATELTLPPIPPTSPLTGVLPGQFELQLEAITSYGRFDYQDHTLLDLLEPRAYTVHRVTLGFR
ncbi:MAG: hypothetical protein FJ138_02085 [Deltaproteobacteria bacterium]|nr:hypothetical protein [Deltaproteobacteria bacterium]